MKRKVMKTTLWAAAMAVVAVFAPTASAAIVTSIDEAGTTGSTLNWIRVGSQTYTTLIPPTSYVDNKGGSDWLHAGGTSPVDLAAAIGSFDLDLGSLNHSLEAQFGGALTDTSLVYIIINEEDQSPTDTTDVYAIDASGNRLNTVGVDLIFGSTGVPDRPLLHLATFNRTTNGSLNGSLERSIVGGVFSLAELGLGGLGAVGIEFETGSMDFHELGLATQIPEPSSLGLLILGQLGLCLRRKKK